MNKKRILSVVGIIFIMSIFIVIILISLSTVMVVAHPALPTEFYGTVRSYNSPASGVVKVYTGNVSCGSFTIVNSGYYGVLSCIGRDTDASNFIGGIDGQNITFRYNNNPVTTQGDTIFNSGTFKYVNLTYPLVFCGDSFCDVLENCNECPQDCNACNSTGNTSQNVTGNATSNETTPPGPGSGGGGSGSGSGGGGAGGGGAGGVGGAGAVGGALGQFTCSESWTCMNWSDCSILGIRNRTCIDRSGCGTYNSRPKEVEECTYIGTCFDNLINCHDAKCEEGVDCNGPCEKKCPTVEQPLFNISVKVPTFEIPSHVCERHINFSNSALLLFLIIIFSSILVRVTYSRIYIYRSRKDEKLTPLERAKRINSTKRKSVLFIITLVSLTIVSLLYCYYFLLCPSDFFEYSWLLILAIILIPFVVHAIMKKFEYNESKHVYKSRKLDDMHYQSLIRMIELENNILSDEENAIANKLYELSKKDEFKELLETDQNLKDIYKNLVKLYADYKEKKNPFNIERDVCSEIDALDSDELFKSSIKNHPEMAHIFDRLKKIYSQYEEKQKLYDKLDELEQSGQKEKIDKKEKK